MQMRAMYSSGQERQLPELLEKGQEITPGKSPLTKANFTDNYLKLKENTKQKKTLDHTETVQSVTDDHKGPHGGKYVR